MFSAAHIFFVGLFFFFHTLSFSHAHSLSFFARFCAYSCGCILLFLCCSFSCFRACSHICACISLLPHVSLTFLSSLYIVLLEPVIPSVLYFGTGQFFFEIVPFFYLIGVFTFPFAVSCSLSLSLSFCSCSCLRVRLYFLCSFLRACWCLNGSFYFAVF